MFVRIGAVSLLIEVVFFISVQIRAGCIEFEAVSVHVEIGLCHFLTYLLANSLHEEYNIYI